MTYKPVNGYYGTEIVYYTRFCEIGLPGSSDCDIGELVVNVVDNSVDLSENKSTFGSCFNVKEDFVYTILFQIQDMLNLKNL